MVEATQFFWKPDGYAQLLWNFPKGLTLNNILYYLYDAPSSPSGVGTIVIIFMFVFLFKPVQTHTSRYIIFSIALTYTVLTILNDKSYLYMVYTYPLLVITTIGGIINIKNRALKTVLLLLFTLTILVNFIFTLFNFVAYRQVIFTDARSFTIFPNYDSKFTSRGWPTQKFVYDNIDIYRCPNKVLLFPDDCFFNISNLSYFLEIFKRNVSIIAAYNFYNPAFDKYFDINIIEDFDCIITKTGNPGLFANPEVMNFVINYLDTNPNFKSLSFDAPDNSIIQLFIRKHE